MAAIGGNSAGPGWFDLLVSLTPHTNYRFSFRDGLKFYCSVLVGDAVVNVYINHEKKFAFVEMRTVEEASNAMALDGIMFEVPLFVLLSVVVGLQWRRS